MAREPGTLKPEDISKIRSSSTCWAIIGDGAFSTTNSKGRYGTKIERYQYLTYVQKTPYIDSTFTASYLRTSRTSKAERMT